MNSCQLRCRTLTVYGVRALAFTGEFGSSDASGTPTADSARTPLLGCVFCRGRTGVSQLFSQVRWALVARARGIWRWPVADSGCGFLLATVPGPWKYAILGLPRALRGGQ
jgi:hypothetical protein